MIFQAKENHMWNFLFALNAFVLIEKIIDDINYQK